MADQPRERELHELLSHDLVDIYVGSENTHWILHEKLLCHRSNFFRNVFYNKKGSKSSTYGLPDEDDAPFKLFVGWLYSESVPTPKEEKDLGALLDLYLMGEKWEIKKLIQDVLEAVRRWYHDTDSWPGLRRVQYVYANTEFESPMRQLLVACAARMLVLGDGMPVHWEKALRRDGQLAVDVILCVQKWHFEPDNVPDARVESVIPIMEEAEQKLEKKEEMEEIHEQAMKKEEDDKTLVQSEGEEKLTNGIKGHADDDDEEDKKVDEGTETDADQKQEEED
ncbi:Hypothetical protein R9X50_00164100 [Acrodontium crateriforme]|uniref:BTB domain-containing protein n=1 Tax=Acrodontium crateriforme TaxID=150365 RepID=A0AAQ3R5Z9_9PEZI|nr:Hypothetical protein R9X50_00164100 [Acrodontium crateriforme]